MHNSESESVATQWHWQPDSELAASLSVPTGAAAGKFRVGRGPNRPLQEAAGARRVRRQGPAASGCSCQWPAGGRPRRICMALSESLLPFLARTFGKALAPEKRRRK